MSACPRWSRAVQIGVPMDEVDGARSFRTSGDGYDAFMGRYSRRLAPVFAGAAGVTGGQHVLDIGCGPGALTGVLVDRVGADAVSAFDPSESFVEACATRFPGVDVRLGRAEEIPFDDGAFDVALSQLVLHFVSDGPQVAAEMRRVLRPGGTAGACVWDFAEGMEMLRHFWDSALIVDPRAPDEARTLRYSRKDEIAELLDGAGFEDIVETTLAVSSTYGNFDELWSGLLLGIGPAGSFCVSLPADRQRRLRDELFRRVGEPDGEFTLRAVARCATGRAPA